MKLTIISHTPHYKNNGLIFGWGPTVREINHLRSVFDKIYHVAPLYKGVHPDSFIKYDNQNIKFIPIMQYGGPSFKKKIQIILTFPSNLFIIHKVCKNTDWIQFRSPTSIGLYVLPYLKFFNKKKYWVKYAGNWNQKKPPISYFLQKFWLKYIAKETKVTVNGKWEKQRKHIYSFENPCFSKNELNKANFIKKTKIYSEKVKICFVGTLEKGKGAHLLLDALEMSKQNHMIQKVYIVGDGIDKGKIKSSSKKLVGFDVKVTGSLSREKLDQIYSKCHILILPSKSEGFPKVIAEAMSFGCVPIVTNVGSIGQYINETNGVLLKNRSSYELEKAINFLLSDRALIRDLAQNSNKVAQKFSFEQYNEKIKRLILNL